MIFKNRWIQIVAAALLGVLVMLLPRPEGTTFEVIGDSNLLLGDRVGADFRIVGEGGPDRYRLQLVAPAASPQAMERLERTAAELGLEGVRFQYVDGLPPAGQRFLAMLAFLVFLFLFEPIPLEITAILIGVLLVAARIMDVKDAWAPYMHPVVVFIMCCLIFAVALDKVGLTRRLGQAIARRAGDSVVRFTFIVSIGLGYASAVMHDAAAAAIGIAVMLPLMKAAGVQRYSSTAKFMMLAVPFACSAGGMGTLVGGGRCMVSAAFLKEFTGIEISFLDWMIFAMPGALVTVPLAVFMVYLVYRPDRTIKLPAYDESMGPWSVHEKTAVGVLACVFGLWLTKNVHGIDYSVTGMVGVAILVLLGVLKWEDIHTNLEWGTALFIFGGGLSLGLAMDGSGAARFFANMFFPLCEGRGWLFLFLAVAVFGALVTNVMANVAAAALILPIVIPLAQLEGVDPRILALCLGMATSFAMLLVIGCPPNAIAYSFGQFRSFDLTKAGLVTMPVLLAALVLVAAVWWRILGVVS